MTGGGFQKGCKNDHKRPPSIASPASPGTPNADLSEYTPTTKTGSSGYFQDPTSREHTPTTDFSDFRTPPNIPTQWDPDHRFVDLTDGSDSERELKCDGTNVTIRVAHPLTLFITGTLLGLFLSIFALLCVSMVDRKHRTPFAAACLLGAIAQTALVISTYKYFGPQKF